jgi:hypothetical protein
MTENNAERIGRMADDLDSCLYTAKLPLPDKMHIECLSAKIREVRDGLVEIVKAETGDNPWETNPLVG